MRTWKLLSLAASFGLAVLLTSCQTPHQTGTSALAPAELVQPAYLYEVTRHLYRWYLDEAEVERVVQARQFAEQGAQVRTMLERTIEAAAELHHHGHEAGGVGGGG